MILYRYLARRRAGKTCLELFTSAQKNLPFTNQGLKRLINALNAASGQRIYAHMFWHTFATLVLEGGCDIYTLSKMRGHADIKTTTIYLVAQIRTLVSASTQIHVGSSACTPLHFVRFRRLC